MDTLAAKQAFATALSDAARRVAGLNLPPDDKPSWHAVETVDPGTNAEIAYCVTYVLASHSSNVRNMRAEELRLLEPYADPPADPGLFALIGQSYLHLKRYYPQYLKPLTDQIKVRFIQEGECENRYDMGRPGFREIIVPMWDIIEKLGMLVFHRERTPRYNDIIAKIHFYSFIFTSKALLDSVAVLLNQEFGLGFSGGEIDLAKDRFRTKLVDASREVGDEVRRLAPWIENQVVKRRHALIHRRRVSVWSDPIPSGTLYIPKNPEVDPLLEARDAAGIMKIQQRLQEHYVGLHGLYQDWLEKCEQLLAVVTRVMAERLRGRYS